MLMGSCTHLHTQHARNAETIATHKGKKRVRKQQTDVDKHSSSERAAGIERQEAKKSNVLTVDLIVVLIIARFYFDDTGGGGCDCPLVFDRA